MVDVSGKAITARRALARGSVRLQPATLRRLRAGRVEKGAVLDVARIAAIQAAKRTSDWIPLCHPVPLASIKVDFAFPSAGRIEIRAEAVAADRTGVEMEALVAVAAAALTIYDMLKAIERGISIETVELLEKDGGRSGSYRRGGRGKAGSGP